MLLILIALAGSVFAQTVAVPAREQLVARAKTRELATTYTPVPGDPLMHHAAGYAKVVCSAVFISKIDADFAADNLGLVVAPLTERNKLGRPVVDRTAKQVHINLPDGRRRTAQFTGDQGCVTLPAGKSSLGFKPVPVRKNLVRHTFEKASRLPSGLDSQKIAAITDAAFSNPKEMTSAFLVTWRGKIIAERYGENITPDTPLEGWSMGKSIIATLMGSLIHQGVYRLDQPAPIPEWSAPDDPRRNIRIQDLLRMSGGLRISSPNDPEFDPSKGYPDHIYYYTGDVNMFRYAATRPQQWPPNTVGRYRNTDPVLISYLIRLAVEKRGEDYLSFPQRQLFDPLGIGTMVLETDAYGNFMSQGYDLGSARDWARLGNLYLQDGVWNGKRILPKGFTKFVSTPAPAWVADGQPEYGGLFWVNGVGRLPLPKDAYYMAGAGNQYTIIVPSHDLVIVRLGHYRGLEAGSTGLFTALKLLTDAVPGHPVSRH
jgi:CubicO group peptidase (beta-lactamase class C family)